MKHVAILRGQADRPGVDASPTASPFRRHRAGWILDSVEPGEIRGSLDVQVSLSGPVEAGNAPER
ncbi:MAG: hypothetical protein AB7V14_06180 [Kiritimatiellia bacterium]